MKRFGKVFCLLAIVSLVFIFAGCAKKKVEQVGEVTPPQQQEKEVGAAAGPKPDMAMPGTAGGAGGQVAQAGQLTGDAAAFEQNDIHFDYDSYTIRPEDRNILGEKARYLNAHPNVKARVEGHCDERGTTEYNLALGERRAKAAQEYLVFLGIKPDRISTVSFGEEKPLDPGTSEEAFAKNRRGHFVILGQ